VVLPIVVASLVVGAFALVSFRSPANPASATPSGGPTGAMEPLSSSSLPSTPTSGPTASASGCPARATGGPAGCPAPTTGAPAGGAAPDQGPPFAAAAGKRWNLSFSEEFNGSDYDRRKLTPCFDWNYGDCTSTFNNGREHYQPSQVVVSGGSAKLIAAPASPPFASNACQGGSCTYKAGLLSTARPRADNGSDYLYKFTYGYVESRFKFPATRGFFTAFWMLPTDPGFSYRSEIDILELLGDDPTTMFMTYHYNGRNQSYPVNKGKFNNGACAVKDYSQGFVRMGLDWEPNRVAWFIDGKKCAEFTDASQIENGPMQLILHMMVDNNWQRRWNVGLTDPTLVRQLEVDYIRVYRQVPA
jgi:beta-glucanase (GH16 family)